MSPRTSPEMLHAHVLLNLGLSGYAVSKETGLYESSISRCTACQRIIGARESTPAARRLHPDTTYQTKGRIYQTFAFKTDAGANSFMESNPGWGLLDIEKDTGLRHVAALKDKGKPIEQQENVNEL